MTYRLLFTLENGRKIYSETLGVVDIFTKAEMKMFTPVLEGGGMAFSKDYSALKTVKELKEIGTGMHRVIDYYFEPTILPENKKYRQKL